MCMALSQTGLNTRKEPDYSSGGGRACERWRLLVGGAIAVESLPTARAWVQWLRQVGEIASARPVGPMAPLKCAECSRRPRTHSRSVR